VEADSVDVEVDSVDVEAEVDVASSVVVVVVLLRVQLASIDSSPESAPQDTEPPGPSYPKAHFNVQPEPVARTIPSTHPSSSSPTTASPK